MDFRLIRRLVILAIALGFAVPVSAGELGEFFSSIARDTKRRNCWPDPFIYSDRQLARQTLALQINTGWERQNLLSDFHFMPDGKDLTEAGRMRVQWIVGEAPEPHRQVYVHRGNTPLETAVRMQTVQRYLAQSPYSANVPVLESTRMNDGTPADRIDAVAKKAAKAIPDPVLGGGGGGGGAGGGGGSSGH